ncbi:MAG: FtsK/SpoIIIE domain-containing protein [Arsenophonus sp. NC-PE1-MAG3]
MLTGITSSDKSICMNSTGPFSILYKANPENVCFIMINSKIFEFSIYEGIPYFLTKVITDMKDTANAQYVGMLITWNIATNLYLL